MTPDIGILIIAAYFGFRGFQRGLIEELGRLVGLILAVVLANQLAPLGADLLPAFVKHVALRKVVAFLVIFVLTLAGMGLVTRLLRSLMELVLLGWLDKAGGIAFGVVKSVLIMGVLIYAVENFERGRQLTKDLESSSYVYPSLVVVKNVLFDMFALDEMIKDVHERVKEIEPEKLLRPLIEEQ